MPPILGSNLVDESVMTSDGKVLGELYNITMDAETGELAALVVDPGENVEYDDRYRVDEEGRYHVPADRVRGFGDYITVN